FGKLDIVELACGRFERKPSSLSLPLLAPMAERTAHIHAEHGNAARDLRSVVPILHVSIGRHWNRRDVTDDSRLLKGFPRGCDERRIALHWPSFGHDPSSPPARGNEQQLPLTITPDTPGKNPD